MRLSLSFRQGVVVRRVLIGNGSIVNICFLRNASSFFFLRFKIKLKIAPSIVLMQLLCVFFFFFRNCGFLLNLPGTNCSIWASFCFRYQLFELICGSPSLFDFFLVFNLKLIIQMLFDLLEMLWLCSSCSDSEIVLFNFSSDHCFGLESNYSPMAVAKCDIKNWLLLLQNTLISFVFLTSLKCWELEIPKDCKTLGFNILIKLGRYLWGGTFVGYKIQKKKGKKNATKSKNLCWPFLWPGSFRPPTWLNCPPNLQ